MSQIQGRNVLITGGGSGIGRLMALKMAALGARVILWDISQPGLEKVAAEIRKSHGTVYTYRCDVSNRAEVYVVADAVRKDAGPVDILINNAGVVTGKSFLDCTDDQIEKCMGVNIMAHFWTVRAFMPDMIRRKSGHIVTIASSAGIVGVSRLTDYCTAKFAAFGLDEALRMEIKKSKWKIRTTVVCPYFINTGMFEGAKTRFSWLLPILEEEYAAERIVRAIKWNRPRLLMPRMVYTVWLLRYLPVSLFDMVVTLLGVNASMESFKGRGEAVREPSRSVP